MLCCVGLIGGFAVGQYLGGPWTAIAPAAGFAIGLAADMKFMKGHHMAGHQHDAGVRARKATDPVCGMQVDEDKARYQAEHMGKTYYFCAPGCKKEFEKNAEKYLGRPSESISLSH